MKTLLTFIFLFILCTLGFNQITISDAVIIEAGAGLIKTGANVLSVEVDGVTITIQNNQLVVATNLAEGRQPDYVTIDTTATGLLRIKVAGLDSVHFGSAAKEYIIAQGRGSFDNATIDTSSSGKLRVKPGGLTTTQFAVRGTQLYWIADTNWVDGLHSYVDDSNNKWFIVHVDSTTINIVNNKLKVSSTTFVAGTGIFPIGSVSPGGTLTINANIDDQTIKAAVLPPNALFVPSLTVNAGDGLGGGGPVQPAGSVSLNLNVGAGSGLLVSTDSVRIDTGATDPPSVGAIATIRYVNAQVAETDSGWISFIIDSTALKTNKKYSLGYIGDDITFYKIKAVGVGSSSTLTMVLRKGKNISQVGTQVLASPFTITSVTVGDSTSSFNSPSVAYSEAVWFTLSNLDAKPSSLVFTAFFTRD